MIDFKVIPECYIDTKLIKVLVPPQNHYNHQKGCSNVVKVMKEKLAGDFALGIIDRDKVELGYASEFDLATELTGVLQLCKHRTRNHYLIFIEPAIEKWIIRNADDAGISLINFGLPHDFDSLRKLTKTSKSENNDPFSFHFQKLFKELKRQSPKGISILSFWINYLKANQYNANLQYLIDETNRLNQ
ncbi:hypothetical protein P1X15_21975 [Runella sp. MFBS21]|uniref:hypothetical protein n=1 Tax=Runella sp. MFBS21 TaxID=3034018 RepID=UPI0023F729BD|nr:hypothetical protein [Runella sp. MFBS21]MDF7820305.1 hypothetical protein [Runella sp. MFBS21]